MSKILTILLAIMFAAVGVFAQSENNLKQQSEGKRVTRKYIVSSSHRHVTVELGPRTTYIKEGLSAQAVVRLLGQPVAVVERTENGKTVTSYEFTRSQGRILTVEFVDNSLVRSRTSEVLTMRPKASS